MKNKEKIMNWQLLLAIILGITLISVTIFAVNNESKEVEPPEPEKIYVGFETEEPLDNFSRDGAVLAMQELLSGIKTDVEGQERTVEERMKALDNEETEIEDVINSETLDKIYLSDDFKKSQFNRQFAASVLLTYHQLIEENTENSDFKPLIDNFDEVVYLDNKFMTAHIPLDVFIGENKGIAFEMQYVDGEWKFNPYTSMMSLVMVVNYENQIEEMLKGDNSESN